MNTGIIIILLGQTRGAAITCRQRWVNMLLSRNSLFRVTLSLHSHSSAFGSYLMNKREKYILIHAIFRQYMLIYTLYFFL